MTTHTIRAAAFEGFRSLLWEHDVNPSEILAALGLDESLWENPDAPIPLNTYRRALNLAAAATQQPQFGLLLSQRQSLSKFGAVGYLMKHANTLRDSLECLGQYLRIHDESSRASLEIHDDVVLWKLELGKLTGESVVQHTEHGAGLGLRIIRILISKTWKPKAVYFEHAKPECTKLYDLIFQCSVFFEQSANMTEFPKELLNQKLPDADPQLYSIIRSHLESIKEDAGDAFLQLVQQSIQENLEHSKPLLSMTAKRLEMNAAQLQRRLKLQNTTFQEVLQDVRFGLACKYLTDTDLPLSSITALLAFADPAVFSRSFKHSASITPSAWRNEHKIIVS
ncbi:MAG: AraC family transcriptional regulator [Robiginitomaculum sp.]|nr:AraC family transcriptional regulator [Robiginitomaculum sp.]